MSLLTSWESLPKWWDGDSLLNTESQFGQGNDLAWLESIEKDVYQLAQPVEEKPLIDTTNSATTEDEMRNYSPPCLCFANAVR